MGALRSFLSVVFLLAVLASSSFAKNLSAEKYGFMKDPRDGQIYKIVKIGNQVWMAENLNYETEIHHLRYEREEYFGGGGFDYDEPTSHCYGDLVSKCLKYGRLYSWAVAMNGNGEWIPKNSEKCSNKKTCSPTYPVQGICPVGWHLPTREEWDTLISVAGGGKSGKSLKSSVEWYNGKNGTDAYGFSALPAGMKIIYRHYGEAKFSVERRSTYFWSSTELDSINAYGVYLFYYKNGADLVMDDKELGGSVRCIKNDRENKDERETGLDSSVSLPSSNNAAVDEQRRTAESITDPRDGHTYKTVTIGAQTWMAENLNYKTANSFCYGDKASNCAVYGRLYPKEESKKICPADWHLPSQIEWNVLFAAVGKNEIANKVLKSTTGWFNGGGSDAYGFSALPAGFRFNDGQFSREGFYTFFWSSEGADVILNYYNIGPQWSGDKEIKGASVRCVKNVSKGTMTDSRDGQVYKTVKIGSQIWMAENLNYKTFGSKCLSEEDRKCSDRMMRMVIDMNSCLSEPDSNCSDDRNNDSLLNTCFSEPDSNCSKYGRLYSWDAAMGIADSSSTESCDDCKALDFTYPVQGACPAGWHLPNEKEWETLIKTVGGNRLAGKVLKSTTGWSESVDENERYSRDGNGSDDFGFAALPAGYANVEAVKRDYGKGHDARFWSSLGNYRSGATYFDLSNHTDLGYLSYERKSYRFSVRCVKDEIGREGDVVAVTVTKLDSSSQNLYSGSKAKGKGLANSIGYIKDSRDGQTYKTVKIGSQTWMAENLNYKTKYSFCYGNDSSNCKKYGRLYVWNAAIEHCPAGYHLPDTTEWKTLLLSVGGKFEDYRKFADAGKALKSKTGWQGGNGSDDFGFSALPAGFAEYKGSLGYGIDMIDEYENKGFQALFWSSTEDNSDKAIYMELYNENSNSTLYGDKGKEFAYSVRCVKDKSKRKKSVSNVSKSDSSFRDPRDGRIYKTVKIGSQTWMAENLNFKMKNSSCYKNADTNCTKYGRFYEWEDATIACPWGWHLPDTTEWNTLFATVGGQTWASKALKSKSHWKTCKNWNWQNGNGTDDYGFSVLPSGNLNYKGFYDEGEYASFWSSSANNDNHSDNSVYYVYMVAKYSYNVYQSSGNKSTKKTVRCVKD